MKGECVAAALLLDVVEKLCCNRDFKNQSYGLRNREAICRREQAVPSRSCVCDNQKISLARLEGKNLLP
jgi:hypothetical protein